MIKSNTWRVDISKDVMTLREYKLQELHRFTKSLVVVCDTEKSECVMLKDLLEKVTAYTMEAIKTEDHSILHLKFLILLVGNLGGSNFCRYKCHNYDYRECIT